MPVGDTSIGEDDADCDEEFDADCDDEVDGADGNCEGAGGDGRRTPRGSHRVAQWLTLRVVRAPAGPCQALPTAQTCERVLTVQVGPGEPVRAIAGRLRVAIAHGAAGFAFE